MIIKFHPFHIKIVELQEKQVQSGAYISDVDYMKLTGPSYTFVEDGEFTACFGMEVVWNGRAQVWAHIGQVKNWVKLTRALKNLIIEAASCYNIRRLELLTEEGFTESERWAELLGFERECVLKKYGIDGRDNTMWVML